MRRFAIGATILLALAAGAGAVQAKATFHLPGVTVDGGLLRARFLMDGCPWVAECGLAREAWDRLGVSDPFFEVEGAGGGVFTVRIDMPVDGTEPEVVVRALSLSLYHHYRSQRLAELSVLVPRQEETAGLLSSDLRTKLSRLVPLQGVVPGVVDPGRSLAASAERVEELRRRLSDVRIEIAVGEARIEAIQLRIAKLPKETVEDAIARLVAARTATMTSRGLGPGHASLRIIDAKIEALRSGMEGLPESPILVRLRERLVDLEVDQIALEETAKALTKALEQEYERGAKLRAVAPRLERLTREIETLEARVAEEEQRRYAISSEREELRSGKPVALTPK